MGLTLMLCVCISHSVVPNSATPRTVAHQVPPSMEFSRQEYWNGLPFPFPGDLTDPGIKPGSPALQADSLLSESPPLCYSCLFLLFVFNWRAKQLLYSDKLLYNVLVSAIQHESAITAYIYIYVVLS